MLLAVVAVVATAVLLATGGNGAGQASPPATSAAGWRGLVGSRPRVALGERVIVVLKTPSLAGPQGPPWLRCRRRDRLDTA